MRHRLSGLSTYGLNGRCLGDEHLAYAPLGYGPFTLISSLTLLPYSGLLFDRPNSRDTGFSRPFVSSSVRLSRTGSYYVEHEMT